MKKATYRDLAWASLAGLLREAAGTGHLSKELEAAIVQFRGRFDAAVDAVPVVATALDRRPADDLEIDDGSVDPINRADDIAAQISETFNKT